MVCIDVLVAVVFFFFKQKTAYEMLRSLVGSEMCIRDRGFNLIESLFLDADGDGRFEDDEQALASDAETSPLSLIHI